LFGQGRAEEAVEHLLEIVRRDRAWNDEAARIQLVKFFDALGSSHPLTLASRRRLSSILFS
jgi:putative thioredoxin